MQMRFRRSHEYKIMFVYILDIFLIPFKFERNLIVVTVFPFFVLNQTEFCLVDNQKENCHYMRLYIALNLGGIINANSL